MDQGDPSTPVPYHTHNGVDSPNVDPVNLNAILPIQTNANGQYLQSHGQTASWQSVIFPTTVTIIAGQTISGIEPIAIGNGSQIQDITSPGGTTNISVFGSSNYFYSQAFTTSGTHIEITTVTFGLDCTSSQTPTMTASIFADSGGAPTGSALYAVSAGFTLGLGVNIISFTFNQALTPGTTYHVALSSSNATSAVIVRGIATAGTGAYQSTNNTSSWSNLSTTTYNVTVNESNNVAGEAYLASSLTNTFQLNNFIGFSTTSASAGNDVTVTIIGVVTGLSGLSAGNIYYINDTAGTIGTSPGTNTRHVGIAITSTSLLILPFNPS